MLNRSGQKLDAYKLQRLLGSGVFGDVYLGEHVADKRIVAVKVLKVSPTFANLQDFLREARTFRLHHLHIVQVLDFGIEDETPFLVMAYAPNGTPRQRHPLGTRVPLKTVNQYVQQMADALQYAHENHLIHRDVKPQNMLFDEHDMLLLSDFGLATLAHSEASMPPPHDVGGTLAYIAPEQIQGRPCPASDQYALGVVIYEWLAGKRPFQGTHAELIGQHLHTPPPPLCPQNPQVTAALEQVILQALAKEPQQRFANMRAFATAFEQATQDSLARGSFPSKRVSALLQSVLELLSTKMLAPAPTQALDPARTVPEKPEHEAPVSFHSETGSTYELPPTHETRALPAPNQDTSLQPTAKANPAPRPPHIALLPRSLHLRRWQAALTIVLLVFLVSGVLLYPSVISPVLGKHPHTGAATIQGTTTAIVSATAISEAYNYGLHIDAQGLMYGFNSAHTNWNPYERLIGSQNVHHLQLLWSYTTNDSFFTSPIVTNQQLYLIAHNSYLYAFNTSCRQGCQPLWKYPVDDHNDVTPAISHGTLYVATAPGNVYTFSASCMSNCQPYVSNTLEQAIPRSALVVAGDALLVDTSANALDVLRASVCPQDCQRLMHLASTPDNVLLALASANQTIYQTASHSLTALRINCAPTTCQPQMIWTAPLTPGHGASWATPIVVGNVVYLAFTDGNLYAFPTHCHTSCAPLWTYNLGSSSASLASAHGLLYVNIDGSRLTAFDTTCQAACQPLWSQTIGNTRTVAGGAVSAPMIANDVVYVGSNDGHILAFSTSCRAACQPLWQFSTRNTQPIDSSPMLANGVLYVSSTDGTVYAFGLPN